MALPWNLGEGTVRGTPRTSPLPSPPALPPVEVLSTPQAPVPAAPALLAQGMVRAYFNLTGAVRSSRTLLSKAALATKAQQLSLFDGGGETPVKLASPGSGRPRWDIPLRDLALDLSESGASGPGYVRYVVQQHKRRYGKPPFAAQVFGRAAVDRWLPEYLRTGAAQVAEFPTYRATPERIRQHQERNALFAHRPEGSPREISADIRHASSDSPPDSSGPDPAPPPRPPHSVFQIR